MKKMSIKAYAVSRKLSIYNVVKMAKNGSLPTEIQKVDGKDETFILVDEAATPEAVTIASAGEEKVDDYEKAYFKLKIKYAQLNAKYEALKKKTGEMDLTE